MRWLVNSNGQTSGPMDEATVQALVEARQIGPDALLREETESQWIPLSRAPFTRPAPSAGRDVLNNAPQRSGGDALGYLILAAPFFSGVLVWFGVANINLLREA